MSHWQGIKNLCMTADAISALEGAGGNALVL